MARSAGLVVLLAVMAVLAGCVGPGLDKAGRTRAPPVVLTMASFLGDSSELDGFAGEVRRLSGGTMQIDIRSRWRFGQVKYETGLIGDIRGGPPLLPLPSSFCRRRVLRTVLGEIRGLALMSGCPWRATICW